MLAGTKEPNSGRVTVRGGIRIGVLEQADTFPDDMAISAAVSLRRRLTRRAALR